MSNEYYKEVAEKITELNSLLDELGIDDVVLDFKFSKHFGNLMAFESAMRYCLKSEESSFPDTPSTSYKMNERLITVVNISDGKNENRNATE